MVVIRADWIKENAELPRIDTPQPEMENPPRSIRDRRKEVIRFVSSPGSWPAWTPERYPKSLRIATYLRDRICAIGSGSVCDGFDRPSKSRGNWWERASLIGAEEKTNPEIYSSNNVTWRCSPAPCCRRRVAQMTASTVNDSSAVRDTKIRCVFDRW